MKGSGDCEVSSEREAVQCFHGCSCGLLGASEELSPLLAGRSATHTRESLRETWAVVTPAHLAWGGEGGDQQACVITCIWSSCPTSPSSQLTTVSGA